MSAPKKPFSNSDVGLLLLRIAVGGLMLFHGIDKLINGTAGEREMLAEKGLPEFMGYGVPFGEVVAPILILIGFFTRPAALVVSFTMVMAVYLADGIQGLTINEHGGLAIELNLLYLLGGLTLFFTGAGRISVRKGMGDWD